MTKLYEALAALERQHAADRERLIIEALHDQGGCFGPDSSCSLCAQEKSLSDTLNDRGANYGDFTNNARVAQQMRAIIRNAESWHHMTAVQQEGLDAIILKISRIITGDPDYPDNWHDIRGYAKLVEDRLPETSAPAATP